MRTAALLATVVGSVIALGLGVQPGGTPAPPGGKQLEPKPVTLQPRQPFDDAREVLRRGPTAQRITVSVKSKGQSAAGANILLKIAPGKERDQRDARVAIDAGDLRVYIADGQLTAVTASNPTTYYAVDLEGPATPQAIAKALHPLPLPELAVFFSPGGAAVGELTPYTRRIEWQPVTVPVEPPPTKITLTGSVDGKPGASLVFEYQADAQDRHAAGNLRIRSFTCPIGATASTSAGGSGGGAAGGGGNATTDSDDRMITTTSAWTDPGDPAAWKISTDKRTRVDSLAALGIRIDPPSPPPASPEIKPSDTPEPQPKSPAEPVPAKPAGTPKGG